MIPSLSTLAYVSVFGSIFAILIAVLAGLYYILKLTEFQKEKQIKTFYLFASVFVIWFFTAMLLGISNFYNKQVIHGVPNLLYILIGILGTAGFLFKTSQTFRSVIDAIPTHWIIGLQLYRILAFSFLILYAQKYLPAEFALPAGIGDIVIGVTAPFVAYWYYKKSQVRVVWRLPGTLLAFSI